MEKRLKDLLALVSDQVKFAEGKNAGLVAFDTAAAAALMSFLASRQALPFGWRVSLLTMIVLLVASCVLAIVSFLPKLDHFKLMAKQGAGRPEEPDNLYYFRHLTKYNRSELIVTLAARYGDDNPCSDRECLDLAAQVVINAKIATAKHQCFWWGAILAIGALVLVLLTFLAQPVFVNDMWT